VEVGIHSIDQLVCQSRPTNQANRMTATHK
jgi:hypothetical protein